MAAQGSILQNKFTDGMALDYLESVQPNTSYRYARNAVLIDKNSLGFGISNEESNELVADAGSKVVGELFVERLNASILFLEGDILGMFDHEKDAYVEIARASEFECRWDFSSCEWISAEYKTLQPCDELYVYFSSKCTYYRINISELLNPVRKKNLIDSVKRGNKSETNCDYSCSYFKLMNCVCSPKVVSDVSENGGHSLEGGVYKFAFQLEDKEGNKTNWSEVTQPIYVGSESNMAGERTSASISIHLTSLDCRYDVVNIAVINGFGDAQIVAQRQYSTQGITFTYYGQKGKAIDLEEIVTKGKKYFRGRSLAQKDSRLYLYNIRQEKNPNMQRRVFESANLNFITIETTAKHAERYNFKSLQRGENYLFGVVYKYCDGTHSPVFLLDPKGSGEAATQTNLTTKEASKPVKPTGKEERYIRLRGNNNSGYVITGGCSGGTCGSGGSGFAPGAGDGVTDGDQVPGDPNADAPINEVENWVTNFANWENSARCEDCHPPICCQTDEEGNVTPVILPGYEDQCAGCEEDENAIANDGPDLEQVQINQLDTLTYWATDTSQKPSSTSIIEASKTLIDAINNAEVVSRQAANYFINTDGTGGSSPAPDTDTSASFGGGSATDGAGPEPPQTSSGIPWGDYYFSGDPNSKNQGLDGKVNIVSRWVPGVKETVNLYPDTKDCNGEYIYGGKANQKIRLFRTPTSAQDPIVVDVVRGVPNRFSPSVDPQYAAKVRLLGIEVTNVPLPANDEDWFPKPLCPNEPYRIVMVERDQVNSTVQANCLATSTFVGKSGSGNEFFYFPRHGMCSRDKVDFHVYDPSKPLNQQHIGRNPSNRDGYVYNLHGLDTNIGKVGLSGTVLRKNNFVLAQGYRYGLYAEGEKPTDRLNGNRIDQRGARQFLNANIFQGDPGNYDITGISYVNANSKSTNIEGLKYNAANGFRESSVFCGVNNPIGPAEDNSFKTDTLDHEVPISNAHGWYVSVVRNFDDQYGDIPGMKFIDTGVRAFGRFNGVKGICGDVYIGPYAIKRTGYVSDHVGEQFNTGGEQTESRPRTVCESPDDLLLQNMQINHYPTRLPKSGDTSDAKNHAGGYGVQRALAVQNSETEPTVDYYYPKVQKTLVLTWLESRINPWKRATGPGDQKKTGFAYYPKLKGMNLDSYAVRDMPWEDSFLNRFYYRVEQPSPAQLLRKALIRNIVELILPALGLLQASEAGLPTEITAYFAALPALIGYWKLAKDVITREDYLNKMVGISDCKRDSEGGEPDNHITNFEDNYHEYNYQYSVQTFENYYRTMPLDYNTCVCDDCTDNQTTNEIYFSNKQLAGTSRDTYKNFMALQYGEVGADRGKLRKLFRWNGDFYAHTTDGIFQIKYAETRVETSRGLSVLGIGGMIIEPVQMMEGIVEGFLGLQDPNASIVTPFGYFFIDREARRIYRFDGRSPEEISSKLLYNFFKENLSFCKIQPCHDEKKEDSTYYSLGWDNRYNRLLVTKKSQETGESFTISYYPLLGEGGKWGSFHDYIPQFYMWNRNGFYSVTGGKIYKHNIKNKYQEYYGNKYPFEVQFVANAKGEWFNYNWSEMHTLAESGDIKGIDKTFEKIAVWNFTQGTGTLPLKLWSDNKDSVVRQSELIEEGPYIPMRMARRKYTFNELKDHTLPNCSNKPMTLIEDCEWYPVVNDSIFSCDPPADGLYTNKTLKDDHLVYRLSFSGDNKTRLRLLDFKTYVTQDMQ